MTTSKASAAAKKAAVTRKANQADQEAAQRLASDQAAQAAALEAIQNQVPPAAPALTTKLYFGNTSYDFMQKIFMVILPAIGALYFALSGIWGLPNAEQVIGSITAVDVLGGVLLGVSKRNYNASDAKYDGDMHVLPTENGQKFALSLNGDPADLVGQDQVTFKVNPPQI